MHVRSIVTWLLKIKDANDWCLIGHAKGEYDYLELSFPVIPQ